MKIWLDTLDYNVISDALSRGILYGVTTNPSILSTSTNIKETLQTLLTLQPGPIAVQVTSHESEEMILEGLALHALSPRIFVKVPVTAQGCIALKQLKEQRVPLMGTAVIYPSQALLASQMDLDYMATYFSHMGGFEEACTTHESIFMLLNPLTQLLVASLREVEHILYCAALGAHAVTLKPELYLKLTANTALVESLMQNFSLSWSAQQGKSSLTTFLNN